MKHFRKYLFLLLFSAGVMSNGMARQVDTARQGDSTTTLSLTLLQVCERAEKCNKEVQVKQLQVESSREALLDARSERLPDIDVSGELAKVSNMPVYEDGIFQAPSQFEVIHTYYTTGGDAYFNVYSGNKTNLDIATGKIEAGIALDRKALTVSEVKLRAAACYLDMQRSLVFKALLLQDIAARERQLLQIEELQKNGVVLKSDVLRATLTLSKQKLALVRLDDDIAIANQKMDILIGLPDDQLVHPAEADSTDPPVLQSYNDYLAEAASHAYPARISAQETELGKVREKIAKAATLPRIGLFAEYAYSYPQIFLYPYAASMYGIGMVGIRASFPISSLYHNNHKVKAAEWEWRSEETEHADIRDQVRQQVKEVYLHYTETLYRITVAQKDIVRATENLRIVTNTYFNQLSLLTDLLDAETQLLQARFDLESARVAARLQYYQLQKVIGNL